MEDFELSFEQREANYLKEQAKLEKAKALTKEITDFVNTFGDKSKEFNEAMSREHRTLQQSFTRLALKWLEHVASDEYRTDGRNESSQKVVREMLDAFKKIQEEKGFTGETLELMSKPSGYCSHI